MFQEEKKIEEAPAADAPKPEEPKKKQRRGFAMMDRAKVREIARRGGAASHARGTAHRFTSEEARAAGQKGGKAPHRARGRRIPLETTPPPDEGAGTAS